MPNGFDGSKEEWTRLEAPLREVDPILEAFASTHGLTLTRNYHGEPERSLKHDGEVRRVIQVFVGDEKAPTYKVWLCAWQDRGLDRYWKRRLITEASTPTELKNSISDWLTQGYAELFEWSADDLAFAIRLHDRG